MSTPASTGLTMLLRAWSVPFRIALMTAVTSGALPLVGGVARAQAPCDPALPRNESQAAGYRQRSDRCEGIYKRDVASFGVQLVSLTGAPGGGQPLQDLCTEGQAAHLVWPRSSAPSRPIRLQVESLRRQLFYRLDSERPAQSSSYEWPSEPRCSNEVRLRGPELGVLARTQSSLADKPIDVLLPVALSSQPAAGVRPPYRAALVAGRRVSEVYITLWRYANPATPERITFERPLDARPYLPGVPIIIGLSEADVKERGLYRLRASVEFESGERETLDVYFLNG
jgi:hypothetical protein